MAASLAVGLAELALLYFFYRTKEVRALKYAQLAKEDGEDVEAPNSKVYGTGLCSLCKYTREAVKFFGYFGLIYYQS